MIGNLSDRQFIVCDDGVNLRKSFQGLMSEVETSNGAFSARRA